MEAPKGEVVELVNDINFAGDSLMCEWGYVVDLTPDVLSFEVHKGFNKEPLPQGARFANIPAQDDKYHQIKLVKKYHLGKLPTNVAFLKQLVPQVWTPNQHHHEVPPRRTPGSLPPLWKT